MSDDKDGFVVGGVEVGVSDCGKMIFFETVGDPCDNPILYTKDLNEFYEKLGEIVKHVNSNK